MMFDGGDIYKYLANAICKKCVRFTCLFVCVLITYCFIVFVLLSYVILQLFPMRIKRKNSENMLILLYHFAMP